MAACSIVAPVFLLQHVLEIVPARAAREAAIGVILRDQGFIEARARPLERPAPRACPRRELGSPP